MAALAVACGLTFAVVLPGAPALGASGGLATLVGAGILDRLACIGCVAGITATAVGGTPLAVLLAASAFPSATAACLTLCTVVALQ
jgi:hypothetical protein